jgi:hypothetical protein
MMLQAAVVSSPHAVLVVLSSLPIPLTKSYPKPVVFMKELVKN